MSDQKSLQNLLDGFAELVASKVLAQIGSGVGSAGKNNRPRLLDVDGTAQYLGRSKQSVQHLISSGRLPVVRMDRRVFVDVRDLDALIEESK